MFKWILVGLAAALTAGAIVWTRHSVKVTYVNGLPAYEHVADRQYIFERECYIFKFKEKNTDLPLVADHAIVPALPAEVNARFVGANLPEVRILDIAHVGDRFRTVSVRRDEGRGTTRITIEVLFLDEESRKYPRLDTYWILDHSPESKGEAPTFLSAYAVEAPQQ